MSNLFIIIIYYVIDAVEAIRSVDSLTMHEFSGNKMSLFYTKLSALASGACLKIPLINQRFQKLVVLRIFCLVKYCVLTLPDKRESKKYSLYTAPMNAPSPSKSLKNRGIRCLCTFYKLVYDINHKLIHIENYLASIPTPEFNSNN